MSHFALNWLESLSGYANRGHTHFKNRKFILPSHILYCNQPTATNGLYFVDAFHEAEVVLAVEVVVVSGEPGGQREGVVHQRVVDYRQESGRRSQTQPAWGAAMVSGAASAKAYP